MCCDQCRIGEKLRLREIIDNLYLFSLSADSFGEVIAQRTHENACIEGENIFKYLGIGVSEMQFLSKTDLVDRSVPDVVVGKRNGEEHFVLIDTFSSLELRLGLAMEIPHPSQAVGSMYGGKNGRISPAVQRLIDEYGQIGYDPESEISVSRSIASFFELSETANSDGEVSIRLSNMLSAVAELVCLPIECSVIREEFDDGSEATLLHANACLFTAAAMAMAARKYSPKRKLYALISMQTGFVSISLAYECDGSVWRGEQLLRELIRDGDMICELCVRDGKTICSMAPCYADEGLAGVKEQMNALQMLEFWK